MPPLSLWRGINVKTKDYQFIDRQISGMYRIGGTEFWIHKYLGPGASSTGGAMPASSAETPELQIQDMVNMEIRDRKYDPDVYSLKGHYQVSDTEFDLRQFGLFLSNETIFITFHLNDMVDSIGRKLMSGDVIEILHQRDDLVLGQSVPVSKYYVIEDGTRPAEGYSPTWWAHMWRVKCNPITDSQEYRDILQAPLKNSDGDLVPNADGSGITSLADLLSTYNYNLQINDAVLAEAAAAVQFRNTQGAHFYVLAGDLDKPVSVWAGDGIPPNASKPVSSGSVFPTHPHVGEYFVRTDYSPPVLYRRAENRWTRAEINWRDSWLPSNRVLTSFINNTNETTLTDGSVVPQQTNLRNTIKPKLDPDLI